MSRVASIGILPFKNSKLIQKVVFEVGTVATVFELSLF